MESLMPIIIQAVSGMAGGQGLGPLIGGLLGAAGGYAAGRMDWFHCRKYRWWLARWRCTAWYRRQSYGR